MGFLYKMRPHLCLILVFAFCLCFHPVYTAAAEQVTCSAVSHYTGETLRIRYRLTESRGTLLVRVDGTDNRLNFKLSNGGKSYAYNAEPGVAVSLPINMGSGAYGLSVRVFIIDNMAEEVWSDSIPVMLENDATPYLSSSEMVRWSSDMDLANHAKKLAEGKTDAEAALAIAGYIASNFEYHDPNQSPGYIPDPQRVYAEKQGMCFDLAVLTAAMCRSAGIPAALVMGYSEYMGPSKYHAWCSVYLGGEWRALDPTYSLGMGIPADFLDGSKTVVTSIY